MAFWDKWFAPACDDCAEKIVGVEPVSYDGRAICASCHGKAVEAAAKKEAEIEARRLAEEEARKRFEDRKAFGSDPRLS